MMWNEICCAFSFHIYQQHFQSCSTENGALRGTSSCLSYKGVENRRQQLLEAVCCKLPSGSSLLLANSGISESINN